MSFVAVGVVGAGLVVGGAYMKGRAGDIKGQKLENIANTPGLDIAGLSADALANQQKLLPGANALTRDEAMARQQTINDLLEKSMPGFTGLRDKATGTAGSLLAGEIPKDVQDAVQRSAAAKSLGGGFGGSGMNRNLVGRDFGLTSLGLQSQGLNWLSQLRGISPTAQPSNALQFTGPDASQWLGIKSGERAQRMNLYAQAAGQPGQTQAWGDTSTQIGGALLGGAVSGGMGGGGGMMGGMMGGSGYGGSQMPRYNNTGGPLGSFG